MGRLFGTDGVRGIANEFLTSELAMQIGAAGAYVLTSAVHSPRILIGSDTRKSGQMLGAALTAGICSVGGEAIQLRVIPTPALAYLVHLYDADAAVMISASHNPMEYNGIKWFDGTGRKLSDALEDRIESIIKNKEPLPHPTGDALGRVTRIKRAQQDYKEFLQSTATHRLEGLRIVLDCANGAASGIAKEVFEGLGAMVFSFSDEPDGYNINEQCGSTHPERLQQLVSEKMADVGLAFDGDADRLIATDERGNIVNGDKIMGICALYMKEQGLLKQDTLVLTVMSNIGLKVRMKRAGIRVEETTVGDRYVLERMLNKGFNLGGEQSGHMIFTDYLTTGDGMLSAIQLLNVMKGTGKRLSALANDIPIFPQVLANVRLAEEDKEPAMQDKEMWESIRAAEQKLGSDGRVLVRASGTEPLIRVMLEGKNEAELRELATNIAGKLEKNYHGKIRL
ncbi:MAG: phosphoglucosamine mutase [Eubacteriales bacterium]|nr:phosphoglucosamine mutase [Eubacteriales bacterium]